MVGWFKGKGGDKAEAGGKADEKEASKSGPSVSKASSQAQTQPELQQAPLENLQLPKPSSVFEFGQTVQLGQEYMRGVCTGDDPDAIQACTWSLEAATGPSKDKRHAYRIEF